MIGAFRIASHLPRCIFLALGFGQERCSVYADGLFAYLLQPFYSTIVAVCPDLRHLLRVMYAEKVIDGDIYGHHQYQLQAVVTFSIEMVSQS